MPDQPNIPTATGGRTGTRITDTLFAPVRIEREQLVDLLMPFAHAAHIRRHSASVILSRVRLVAALFAVLVPVWSVVDWLVFPWPEWAMMAGMRVASGLVFLALVWPWDRPVTRARADVLLLALLLVPPVFYLMSLGILDRAAKTEQAALVRDLYALMPCIVLAGLAIFPLTALEVVLFALPAFLFTVIGILLSGEVPSLAAHGPTLWLMILVMGAAMVSGISQLHYMTALVNRAMIDPLTGAYTRRSGCETLDLFFRLSAQQGTALTLLFFDLDHFKAINDGFGHDAGDAVLRQAADQLRRALRGSDILVRWGGEEFVAILHATDLAGARTVIHRVREMGLGRRPDGRPVTASIGVAERMVDGSADWPHLVDLADSRMYQAKRQGRDRAVLPPAATPPASDVYDAKANDDGARVAAS
ncbi:MAG: hypothetical protein RLY86_13 [Pseudomonadota bacterium]|jgi:diguanylate cyclase (GGDEF)-like protein